MNKILLFLSLHFALKSLVVHALQYRDSTFLHAKTRNIPNNTLVMEMRRSDFAKKVLPQLVKAPCIKTTSPSTMWLVYHDYPGGELVGNYANAVNTRNDFTIRGIDNSAGDLDGDQERTTDIVPALGDYGPIISENGVIIALGFGLHACKERPHWVGTASWKAVQDNDEPETCRTLPHIMQHTHFPSDAPQEPLNLVEYATNSASQAKHTFELTMREVEAAASYSGGATNQSNKDTNETVFYWYGNSAPHNLSSHFSNDPAMLSKKEDMLVRFFQEVLDMDAASLFKVAASEAGIGLPWKNWFLTTPDVMLTLAKLHALLYTWLDTRYPLEQVGCSPEVFNIPGGFFAALTHDAHRCWGYVGEYASIMYFTSATDLLQIGCDQFQHFHQGHSHNLTQRINVAWEAFSA